MLVVVVVSPEPRRDVAPRPRDVPGGERVLEEVVAVRLGRERGPRDVGPLLRGHPAGLELVHEAHRRDVVARPDPEGVQVGARFQARPEKFRDVVRLARQEEMGDVRARARAVFGVLALELEVRPREAVARLVLVLRGREALVEDGRHLGDVHDPFRLEDGPEHLVRRAGVVAGERRQRREVDAARLLSLIAGPRVRAEPVLVPLAGFGPEALERRLAGRVETLDRAARDVPVLGVHPRGRGPGEETGGEEKSSGSPGEAHVQNPTTSPRRGPTYE